MLFKKVFKTTLRAAFFLLAIVIYFYSVNSYIADTVVTGTKEIAFDIRINDGPVTLSAGSCKPFIWTNLETGEVFGDTEASDPGLGYECNKYYSVTKSLNPGYWTNTLNSAEIRIDEGKSIIETVPLHEVISVYVILFIIFASFLFFLDFSLFR